MGMFSPSSNPSSWKGGVPPPIPGTPSNISPRMQPYLMPLEALMAMSGVDDKLQAKMNAQGASTSQPQPKQTDIAQNTIGVGNPSAMSQVKAR